MITPTMPLANKKNPQAAEPTPHHLYRPKKISFKKIIFGLFLVAILLSGGLSALILYQRNADVRQQASEGEFSATPASNCPILTVWPAGTDVSGKPACEQFVGSEGIQQAIDLAPDNATVLIKNGVYENVNIKSGFDGHPTKNNITITGESDQVFLHGAKKAIFNIESGKYRLSNMSMLNSSALSINSSEVTLKNCTISNSDYIGIYIYGTSLVSIDNLLVRNAMYDGIFVANDSKVSINNSVISNVTNGPVNYDGVGAICQRDNSLISIKNSIIAHNPIGIGIVAAVTQNVKLDHSLLFDNGSYDADGVVKASGPGNIFDQDPRFADRAGGDFHLQAGSPAIDNGDPAIFDQDCSRSDMGIYGGGKTTNDCAGVSPTPITSPSPQPSGTPIATITVCPQANSSPDCSPGYVGGDGLKKAIEDIPSDGTIVIKNGTYNNTQTSRLPNEKPIAYLVNNKNLKISGESKGGVILDGNGQNAAGIVVAGNSKVEIKEILVMNYRNGFMIWNDAKSIVTDSVAQNNANNGFGAWNNATLTLINSTADDNSIGATTRNNAVLTLINNIFTNNNRMYQGGYIHGQRGVLCDGDGAVITPDSNGNTINNNRWDYSSVKGCPGTSLETLTAPISISPTPVTSPTPQPSGTPQNARLTFPFKLQGLNKAGVEITVKVLLQAINPDGSPKAGGRNLETDVVFRSNAAGWLTPASPINLAEIAQANLIPQRYKILVKTPVSLRKEVGRFELTVVDQAINLPQPIEIGGVTAKVGDFLPENSGNNILNVLDIGATLREWTALSVPLTSANRRFDVNYDDIINLFDINLVLSNWTALTVIGD